MAKYQTPLRDMQFVLHELLDLEGTLGALEGWNEVSGALVDTILEESARLCEEKWSPLRQSGDRQGCRLEADGVKTPDGFAAAYQAYAQGGWQTLACAPRYGGQGLPHVLSVFCEEMLQSANLALSLYPGLTRGAYLAIEKHASQALKDRYLPNMVTGRWSGVMCLTEPHCGTDLGLLRTRAEAADDGSWRVTGSKIFITGGDQDLTENIIHLVLAKLPGAPAGAKGISLLLVPKFPLLEDGSLGPRNRFHCQSLEHKMGIKGASTCVMNYEGATAWLIGEPHQGLRCMFSMMNHERLMVGQQGLALAEVAYQSAADYARERLQGRAPGGAQDEALAADPIIVHPDVRRMLMSSRAFTEGARAMLGWVSMEVDLAERHPDETFRQQAADRIALLTPVVKAWFTDQGFDTCNRCLQVFGGHGYIAEWGMEQLVRDARIAPLYEGTNGIQALDLVARKLPMHGGRLMQSYLQPLETLQQECQGDPAMREFLEPLEQAMAVLAEATRWVLEQGARDPAEPGAASRDYLDLLALVSLAYVWTRTVRCCLPRIDSDNTGFYETKLAVARYFMAKILPRSTSLLHTIRAGSATTMALAAEQF